MTESNVPIRYRVGVTAGLSDPEAQYTVVTWFGREKAVALATQRYVKEEKPQGSIHRLDIVEMGPLATDERDVYVVEPGDYLDRREW